MATQGVNFDFTSSGADALARDFRKTGDNAVLAGKGARLCADALEKQRRAADVSAGATLALAKADSILEEAEHGLRDGALEAEFALKQQAEAEKKAARAALEADAANKKQASSLQKLADSAKKGGGPLWLGPALALLPAAASLAGVAAGAVAGLGGAFVAGGGALAAFGAVAKPVLTDAKKAAEAVGKAQDAYNTAIANGVPQAKAFKAEQLAIAKAYAGMSPAQIALSKQLGDMAKSWDKVKAAETPVVAGALQPWLKSVTDLTGKLGPIIAKIAPVIQGLGTQFGALVNSSAFTKFRDFIGSTGAAAVSAGGSTIIDLVKSFVILLPKFDPLIREAVGWISRLGPAVLAWSSSKKASDDITKFMQWFSQNGPVVGGLIKSIGAALAALAPGLTAGGAAEIKVITGLLNLVAKLPPAVAKPLAEVAGALLILNKLGVVKVGVKIAGAAAGWVKKLLSGATVDIGAAGMQRAGDTMVGAAAGMQRAADTMVGADVAGGAGGAGGVAAKAAGGGLLATGSAGLGALVTGPLIGAAAGIALGLYLQKYHAQDKPPPAAQQGPRGFQPPSQAWKTYDGVVKAAAATVTAAAAAADRATARIRADFTAQGKAATAAMTGIGTLTNSITHNGNASTVAHAARAALISDMTRAGVDATTAQTDVVAYSNAVTANGAKSDQARAARQKLVSDILAASSNSRQGNKDLSAYTTAVQQHGIKSDAARGARQRLITDLVNAGVDARTATGLVNGLGTSIGKLPSGKTIKINVTGAGQWSVSGPTSQTGVAHGPQNIGAAPGGAAFGAYISAGTGPTADDVLIRASRGELVVPARMVAAGAVDHLRGAIPGFAAGGVAGSYGPAGLGGLGPWTIGRYQATETAIAQTTADATLAAMRAAQAAALAAAAAASGGGVQWQQLWATVQKSGIPDLVLTSSVRPGDTGSAHATGNAIDVGSTAGDTGSTSPGTPMNRLYQWLYKNFHSSYELIHWPYGGIKQGRDVGGSFWPTSVWLQHKNHVHWAEALGAPGGLGLIGSTPSGALQQIAMTLLRQYGWGNQWPAFNTLEMHEAGWNMRAVNPSSGAAGLAQFINGFGEYAQYGGDSTTGLGQLTAMMNYIAQRYGSPNAAWAQYYRHPGGVGWYAKGGLVPGYAKGGLVGVPGYATGGTVAGQGQTWLNAWRSRHGGGFGAAHGPTGVNEQIAAMKASIGRAQVLSKARGLSASQHRFWAGAAAGETKRLAVLNREAGIERTWRGQLTTADTGLSREISAAGGLPSLAGPVRSWKAQLKAHQYTIGQINAMLTAKGPAKAAGEPAGLTALQATQQGQTYLNAWRSRHGGGFGAAWGPSALNVQIPAMQAAIGRATTLSHAPGLSAAQHKNWANAAADETKRLAVLRKELAVEQAWRGQLTGINTGLSRDIAAAGGLPSLAGNVKSWKAQLAAHLHTIGDISGMIGYSAAQAVSPVKVTHVYGGDVAATIPAFLASVAAPFGAARGGLVSYDRGGWLMPGATMAVNNTGRPEQVLPARSGGGGRLQVEWVGGNGGDDLERWIRKNVRIRGGGDVQRAYGAR